ncbi:PLP-dependent transferase [uncultured Fusobacterium sp.]|uniref:O-acetylhomoserine aminocarboxypropyltransferase/cysteine synthase family protein n=1 Tax=uncultured Fusobacterium sp. TaxID=159267 RepID=UPI0015A658A4|nr:PLP-dependent transferase [uncultured Fusobacterium sp.]
MDNKDFKIETQLVQSLGKFTEGEPRVYPIVQSTTYNYTSPEVLADLFDLKAEGHMYSRISNPTVEVFENKMAVLEKGVGALAVGSGQSANTIAVLNICKAGDHIVCLSTVYGGTVNLFGSTLRNLGIETTFVSPEASEEEIKNCFKENTKILFGETLGNPEINVLDFEKIAKIAREKDVPFIVDNTLATPYLCNPIEYGANIVTHSATKYIDGQATALGGVIIDGGNYNWDNGKFSCLVDPDPSYHNLSYYKTFGKSAYIVKARATMLRDFGTVLSPFNAFIFNRGLETLHIRMERHSENAFKVAEFLENNSKVAWINYPKLESHYSHSLAEKYLKKGCSGIILVGIKGGKENAMKFIRGLSWIKSVIHLGDSRTCVLHPASTTHRQLTEEEQIKAGVLPEAIRINVGIENIEDILNDIKRGLENI